MENDATIDRQLRDEIARLRTEFPDTPALYREVCALLFFRYGITPTANKLYQLVKKGSMTAPADALGKFWEELRVKTKLRIEHPDLPEALKTTAGELVATLWGKAQEHAQETLAVYRADAQTTVILAQAEATAAERSRDDAIAEIARLRDSLDQLQHEKDSLALDLATEKAKHADARDRLTESQAQTMAIQDALKDARAEFAVELEKLRGAVNLAEERCQAVERKALLEIDQERSSRTRTEKELEAARKGFATADSQRQADISQLQREKSELHERIGKLVGELGGLAAQLSQTQIELKNARGALAQAQGENASLRSTTEQLNKRTEDLAATVKELRTRFVGGAIRRARRKAA